MKIFLYSLIVLFLSSNCFAGLKQLDMFGGHYSKVETEYFSQEDPVISNLIYNENKTSIVKEITKHHFNHQHKYLFSETFSYSKSGNITKIISFTK